MSAMATATGQRADQRDIVRHSEVHTHHRLDRPPDRLLDAHPTDAHPTDAHRTDPRPGHAHPAGYRRDSLEPLADEDPAAAAQPTRWLGPAAPGGHARRRVSFSARARAVLSAARSRDGLQTVVLSWPSGAAYLPSACYRPGEHDILLGEVAGCPVLADVRQLALFPTRRMMLDAAPASRHIPRPALRVRAEDWA